MTTTYTLTTPKGKTTIDGDFTAMCRVAESLVDRIDVKAMWADLAKHGVHEYGSLHVRITVNP